MVRRPWRVKAYRRQGLTTIRHVDFGDLSRRARVDGFGWHDPFARGAEVTGRLNSSAISCAMNKKPSLMQFEVPATNSLHRRRSQSSGIAVGGCADDRPACELDRDIIMAVSIDLQDAAARVLELAAEAGRELHEPAPIMVSPSPRLWPSGPFPINSGPIVSVAAAIFFLKGALGSGPPLTRRWREMDSISR